MLEFPPISLEEMDSIRLMNRTDTKFLASGCMLDGILDDALACGYRVLETGGVRESQYDTLYYDTPGLDMFIAHQCGRLVRKKVRTRIYVDTGLTFLEIKKKDNHGTTSKKRIQIPPGAFGDFKSLPEACRFLEKHSGLRAEDISPALETVFRRITLVNAARTERLTIDTHLCFINRRNAESASLKDAVIIELKQDRRATSDMKRILLMHRVQPAGLSKYCIGIALTDAHVRTNNIKPKVRRIEKIINANISIR